MRLRSRTIRWGFQIAVGGMVILLAWYVSSLMVIQEATRSGRHRLELYAQTLQATIEQYEYLPFVLTLNKDVQAFLGGRRDEAFADELNGYLLKVRIASRTNEIFIVDAEGTAVLSSNSETPQSYVGNSYSFRPYFQQAARGQQGRFYGVGSTTGIPGYFLSLPVYVDKKFVGAVVVKLSFNILEEAWRAATDNIFVIDANGVTFLSSIPDLKFGILNPLTPEAKQAIEKTLQYPLKDLRLIEIDRTVMPFYADIGRFKRSEARNLGNVLIQDRLLERHGWTMMLLSPQQNMAFVILATLSALIAYIAFLTIVHYVSLQSRRFTENLEAKERLQRAHDELELKVRERTVDLQLTNERLTRESIERTQMEATLAATRNELAEANKLAALGQMATGIAHELNQPLAALRTFSENTQRFLERGNYTEASSNIGHITSLVERMAQQTSELRAFTSRHRGPLGIASLQKAVRNALLLLESVLNENNVTVEVQAPEADLPVPCDAIGLEQIFGNLVANAIDALSGAKTPNPTILITLSVEAGNMTTVQLSDNGPGISAEQKSRVFEAFYSTKRRGLGLGLAIIKTIITESGGTISIADRAGGGTVFSLVWPVTN